MSKDNELATVPANRYLDLDLAEIRNVATALAASGIFKDASQANIAFAKILAGQEIGLTPFKAMQELSFINGRPSLSASAKAAAIKSHPKYDYKVVELDDKHCILEFFEWNKSVGKVEFNEEMAKTGGEYNRNPNYKTHPDDMYFAGALRKGQRRHAPDALNGVATYDREELIIDESDVVDVTSPKREVPAMPANGDWVQEPGEIAPKPEEVTPPPEPAKVDPKQLRQIMAQLKEHGITEPESQKQIVYNMGQVKSRTELTYDSAQDIIDRLKGPQGEDKAMLEFFASPKEEDPNEQPF